jgi:tRNA-specific 2-thiouridylase
MMDAPLVIVALSGGVDSAVSALLLREAGYRVQCLHMSNWEDDGYCEAAKDFQDARRVCRELGLPLHRVNFSQAYKDRVFERFLAEYRLGRTPNPDVLCNREIKFGVLWEYARRLGGDKLATGHYARLERSGERVELHKGKDSNKDQSYFLHAVAAAELRNVIFPLANKLKSEVRDIARKASLLLAEKKDSTGICFIGERPFADFLGQYLPITAGVIRDSEGRSLGEHRGLPYYTLGQRHGLGIGGLADRADGAWYVAAKNSETNELIVVQGKDHPSLFQNWLTASAMHWINGISPGWSLGTALKCRAKTRYRQADQACTVMACPNETVEVSFERPQRAMTPGQYVVFYQGSRCLGGATIETTEMRYNTFEAAG